MPYEKISELPKQTDGLPKHAKEIYKEAYNSAYENYKDPEDRNDDASREEVAHKVAWAAVKKKYEKSNGDWIEK